MHSCFPLLRHRARFSVGRVLGIHPVSIVVFQGGVTMQTQCFLEYRAAARTCTFFTRYTGMDITRLSSRPMSPVFPKAFIRR